MAKVTVNRGTSAQSNESAHTDSNTFVVFDSLGKKLLIKKPNLQEQLKYDLYFGKYAEENKKFFLSTQFIMFIKEIDDAPVPFPTKESEVFALAARLGQEGLQAIIEAIVGDMDDEEVDEKDLSEKIHEEKQTIKK